MTHYIGGMTALCLQRVHGVGVESEADVFAKGCGIMALYCGMIVKNFCALLWHWFDVFCGVNGCVLWEDFLLLAMGNPPFAVHLGCLRCKKGRFHEAGLEGGGGRAKKKKQRWSRCIRTVRDEKSTHALTEEAFLIDTGDSNHTTRMALDTRKSQAL